MCIISTNRSTTDTDTIYRLEYTSVTLQMLHRQMSRIYQLRFLRALFPTVNHQSDTQPSQILLHEKISLNTIIRMIAYDFCH